MIEYEGYAEAIVGGARIRNLDSGGEQVLELVRRDEFPSRGLAAVLRSAGSTGPATIFVTNLSERAVRAGGRVWNGRREAGPGRRLAPWSQWTIETGGFHPGDDPVAIDLTHDEEPGDLVAVATMVPGPPRGFAEAAPLRDGAPVQRLHGLGPLIGTEWSGGGLRSCRTVLAAANPGPGPLDADAVLRWDSEDGTRELSHRIELPAGGTTEFEFVPPDNVHAAGNARVEVVSAEPKEAVFAAFSVDDTWESRLEIPLEPSPGIQSGSHPFTMEEGVSVSFHLHNAGSDPQVFRAVIEHEGGEYVFPAVRLDPGGSWQEGPALRDSRARGDGRISGPAKWNSLRTVPTRHDQAFRSGSRAEFRPQRKPAVSSADGRTAGNRPMKRVSRFRVRPL